MRIKFGDVKIGDVAKMHLNDCIENNWVTSGKKVKEFESRFAAMSNYKYSVAVNSGTTADFLSCVALYDFGGKRHQNIIVPALSFIATQNSILAANFIPNPVDIKRTTLNIDENLIEDAINDDTVAIMCVNTMGKPCKMDIIRDICRRHNLFLICDNCEGHFCRYKDKFMSEWADLSTYSFYSAHIIFSVQQGAVCMNNSELFNSVSSLRTHGRRNGELMFLHDRFLGWNGQPTDLHASIGLENLDKAFDIFNQRRYNLNYMIEALKERSFDDVFYFNLEEENDFNSPHALSLTFKDDDEVKFLKFYNYLEANGVQCKLNFKSVFTQQKAMEWMGYKAGDFKEAEFVGRNGLHLACHQYLTKEDLDYIIDVVTRFIGK